MLNVCRYFFFFHRVPLVLFLISCSFNSISQNLINNGDFESGGNGVGFNINGSGYSEITVLTGSSSAGQYAFITNPQPMNTSFFISGGDHTTGSGKMMVIDGNTTGGQQRFWRLGGNGEVFAG
ncbi:MAG: hypothetical protein FGM46_07565 [Ferruginibacter sp.]|nr:hypothetical protein [Ferruginibacter sp.]